MLYVKVAVDADAFDLPQRIVRHIEVLEKANCILICRVAHNQRNRNQPIDFDYYKITLSDYD